MPQFGRTLFPSAAIVILWLTVVTSPLCAADSLRTVALTGTPVSSADPNTIISTLGTRIAPVLNNNGLTAFEATIQVAARVDQAILTEGGGAGLRVAASSNFRGDGSINLISLQALSDQGQTVYNKVLPPTLAAGFNLGIFRESKPGNSVEVVRSRVPWDEAGFAFTSLYNFVTPRWANAVSMFDDGRLVFPARAVNGELNDSFSGIWREDSNGLLANVVRTGDPAPGTAHSFQFFGDPPTMIANPLGRVAFTAPLSINEGTAYGIWSEHDDGLQLEVLAGDLAPGTSGATFVVTPNIGPAFNSRGHLSFVASLRDGGVTSNNNVGLWCNCGSGLALVAREGEQAPGATTGQVYQDFVAHVLNAGGDSAFIAHTRGPDGTNRNGIWKAEVSHDPEPIAFFGLPAPSTEPGVAFDSVVPTPFGPPTIGPSLILNVHGQIAFQSSLQGPGIDATNNDGIWAQDRAGILRLIAREGNSINVSDDPLHPDWRTISSLLVSGASGNDDGRRSWFNDRGQLAFLARFTDGSAGVFVSNLASVPEPSSLALLIVACAVAHLPRRR